MPNLPVSTIVLLLVVAACLALVVVANVLAFLAGYGWLTIYTALILGGLGYAVYNEYRLPN